MAAAVGRVAGSSPVSAVALLNFCRTSTPHLALINTHQVKARLAAKKKEAAAKKKTTTAAAVAAAEAKARAKKAAAKKDTSHYNQAPTR